MSKAEELAALTAFIESLPDDSYLKPWLRQVKSEVARDIMSDIVPSSTMEEARKACESFRASQEKITTELCARQIAATREFVREALEGIERAQTGIRNVSANLRKSAKE